MLEPAPLSIRIKVSDGGRIVIPAEFRKALGLDVGDEIIVRLEGGEIKISSVTASVQRAQEKVRRHAEGRALAEELIAQRRLEDSSHE